MAIGKIIDFLVSSPPRSVSIVFNIIIFAMFIYAGYLYIKKIKPTMKDKLNTIPTLD